MTDAYVAMGLLQPELFLGGEMKLDKAAALEQLGRIADKLGMEPVALAQGAYHIANTKIAAAVAAMTTHRGLDPREFSLLAYGAAGPMHGVAVARELGITEVVVPYFPGGFSAFGMIASRSRVEYSNATMATMDQLGPDSLSATLNELADTCRADLVAQGLATEDITIEAPTTRCTRARGRTTGCRCRASTSPLRTSSRSRRSSTPSTTAASATAPRRSRSS